MLLRKRNIFSAPYLVDLLLLFVATIIIVGAGFVSEYNSKRNYLEVMVLIVYIIILFDSIFKNGLLSLNSIFIATFGIFTFGGIFSKVAFGSQYESVNNDLGIILDDLIIIKTIYINLLFLFSYYIGSRIKKLEKTSILLKSDVTLFKIGQFMMMVSSPALLYRYYIEISFIRNSGVLIYLIGSSSIPIPNFIRLFTIIYNVGFMLIYCSIPPKKAFVKYSILYILLLTPSFLLGIRGLFILSIMFLLWLANMRGDIKIRKGVLLFVWIFLVIAMQILGTVRFGGTYEKSTIGKIIINFFRNQSMSFYVLPLYAQYKNLIQYQTYPFIFDSFFSWLFPSGQSLAVLQSGRSSLGHQLMYAVNPGYYLSGASLGTSMIAELYEFGYIGVLVGGFIYPLLINKYIEYCKKKRVFLFFSIIIVQAVIYAPRASYIPGIYNILRYGIIYGIVVLIRYPLKNNLHSFSPSRIATTLCCAPESRPQTGKE